MVCLKENKDPGISDDLRKLPAYFSENYLSWVFVPLRFLTKIQVLGTAVQRDEQAAGRDGYFEVGQSQQSLSEV